MCASSESEVLAQELSNIAGKVGALETRVKEVEAVIERLEAAAETTARALEEVSAHWDAVYRAIAPRRVVQPTNATTPRSSGAAMGSYTSPPSL